MSHDTRPSSEFGLWWSDGARRCCFCVEPINKDTPIWAGMVNGETRRAHTGCANAALLKVIEARDAKGKSEDLTKESN